jgi:hypothetical protein
MQNSRLKPQARPHALADLEVAIAKAERTRDQRRRALELVDRNGLDADANIRRARGYLLMAENHLAELHRSREVLLNGEQQDASEAEAR